MPRRNKWKIYLDILEVIKENGGSKKTRVMQDAHMSWQPFKNSFNFLYENDLIKEAESTYHLTEDGEKLLKHLSKVDRILENPETKF